MRQARKNMFQLQSLTSMTTIKLVFCPMLQSIVWSIFKETHLRWMITRCRQIEGHPQALGLVVHMVHIHIHIHMVIHRPWAWSSTWSTSALNVSYRRYIVTLISRDFQNIVIAFFFTISHDIFRPFFTNFYLFLLIKNSIFGNTLWFQSSKNDFICIIQTFFTNFTLLAWNLWKIAGNATLNVAFPPIYAHFYQIGNIASIVWLSYQNLKYRVISCGP